MEALRSSETLVLTRATRRSFIEYGILHIHRREDLKSVLLAVELVFTSRGDSPRVPLLTQYET
jgi:hypothetical protein